MPAPSHPFTDNIEAEAEGYSDVDIEAGGRWSQLREGSGRGTLVRGLEPAQPLRSMYRTK
jgi:hypothetical protein